MSQRIALLSILIAGFGSVSRSEALTIDFAKIVSCGVYYGQLHGINLEEALRELNTIESHALTGKFWSQRIRYIRSDPPVDPSRAVLKAPQVIKGINELLAPYLKIPATVDIFNHPELFRSFADQFLFLPNELSGMVTDGISEQLFDAAVAHEYAHLLFSEALLGQGAFSTGFETISKRIRERIILSKLAFLRGEAQLLSISGDPVLGREGHRLSHAFEIARSSHLNSLSIGTLADFVEFQEKTITPYSELFSDLVAAVQSDRPDMIARFLEAVGKPALGDSRNFENNINLETWNEIEPHALFGPTRSWLWKNHFKAFDKSIRARTISRVLEAILKEIEERWATGTQPSPQELNRSLIRRLEIHLR